MACGLGGLAIPGVVFVLTAKLQLSHADGRGGRGQGNASVKCMAQCGPFLGLLHFSLHLFLYITPVRETSFTDQQFQAVRD